MSQKLAHNYGKAIADSLWSLDDSGDIFPLDEDYSEDEHGSPESYYLEYVYDIEYRVDSDKNVRSVKVMIAVGGPNAWIDTGSRELVVYWDEKVSFPIPREFCERITDYVAEIFDF